MVIPRRLAGDKAENSRGWRGVGPVKGGKIRAGGDTEMKLWEACLEAYEGDKERVIENARLLWLRREVDQLWEPPVEQN